MKKKTIGAIILAFDICMVIAIVFLVIKIAGRGPKPEIEVAEDVISEDEIMTTDITEQIQKEGEENTQETERHLVAITNAETSVNVRSGPGTDYQRIGSAYSDVSYEVLEIGDKWVKIQYDENNVGYINSEFVEYKFRVMFEDGSTNDTDPTEEELMEYYNKEVDGQDSDSTEGENSEIDE